MFTMVSPDVVSRARIWSVPSTSSMMAMSGMLGDHAGGPGHSVVPAGKSASKTTGVLGGICIRLSAQAPVRALVHHHLVQAPVPVLARGSAPGLAAAQGLVSQNASLVPFLTG